MKILIIGNGLVASALIQRLEAEGHELLIYSRTEIKDKSYNQIVGDIFDYDSFSKALLWNPQIIIHTAWITTPGLYRNDVSNFKYKDFTIELARLATESEVEHLIVLGTCAEYGRQSAASTAGITEVAPNSLYAEQKVAAFNSVKELVQNAEMRFTWARVFYPYGPFQNHKRLIPYLIGTLKNRKSIQLADTTSIYDWTTTRDIASAILWTIQNEVPAEIDIGTSHGFTNLELLSLLEEMLGAHNFLIGDARHEIGLGEVFVAGENSPLFLSGWSPDDTLRSGLEWVLNS